MFADEMGYKPYSFETEHPSYIPATQERSYKPSDVWWQEMPTAPGTEDLASSGLQPMFISDLDNLSGFGTIAGFGRVSSFGFRRYTPGPINRPVSSGLSTIARPALKPAINKPAPITPAVRQPIFIGRSGAPIDRQSGVNRMTTITRPLSTIGQRIGSRIAAGLAAARKG